MKAPLTRLAYCQYLLVSQIDYTLTDFAGHCEASGHDAINRHLRGHLRLRRPYAGSARKAAHAGELTFTGFSSEYCLKNEPENPLGSQTRR